MKYLVFIYALVFASLVVLPCKDANASQGDCNTEASAHETGDQHSEESSNELCSPFCSCQCCKIQALVMEPFIMDSVAETDPARDHFIPTLSSTEFISIWHPPRA